MSTATSVMAERFGYDKWCVVPDGVTTDPDGTRHHRYKAMFAPVYSRATVRAAFTAQEDAEQLARVLTERNEPF
jgi:hypothetical protein